MKDILKLIWKTTKKVVIPYLKYKAIRIIKSYLWSFVKPAMVMAALAAATVTVIIILSRGF